MKRRRNILGFIYLLHFHRPFHHARHYTGWTTDVKRRVGEHFDATTHSSHLIQAAATAGIGFDLVRVWENKTRNDERQMKKQGGASRRCPICMEERKNGTSNDTGASAGRGRPAH